MAKQKKHFPVPRTTEELDELLKRSKIGEEEGEFFIFVSHNGVDYVYCWKEMDWYEVCPSLDNKRKQVTDKDGNPLFNEIKVLDKDISLALHKLLLRYDLKTKAAQDAKRKDQTPPPLSSDNDSGEVIALRVEDIVPEVPKPTPELATA